MQEVQLDADNTVANTHSRHALHLVNQETAQHLAVKTITFLEPILAHGRENSHKLLYI